MAPNVEHSQVPQVEAKPRTPEQPSSHADGAYRAELSALLTISIRSVRVNPLLLQTLASVGRQTLRPSEVLITIPDNLSEDALSAWNELIETSALPIRLSPGSGSMISQRERSVRAAHTAYVLVMDDDLIFPDECAELLLRTAIEQKAQLVVPYLPIMYPQSRLHKFSDAVFLTAVPYAGAGGVTYLRNGGYRYPTRAIPYGSFTETWTAAGAALLVEREFMLKTNRLGDYTLEIPNNGYSVGGDAAFAYAQKLAGAKMLMVNVGEVQHLGGTTLLSPKRLVWEYESVLRNRVVLWKTYFLPYQRGVFARLLSFLMLLWMLVGIHTTAVHKCVQRRSIGPLVGILRGHRRIAELVKVSRPKDT